MVLAAVNQEAKLIDVKYAKGSPLPAEQFARWNSFSRVSVGQTDQEGGLLILIDSDAGTEISRYSLNSLTPAAREVLGRGGAQPPLRYPAWGEDFGDRRWGRIRRRPGAGIRQPGRYRRRNQPDHCPGRDAGPLCRSKPETLLPPRSAAGGRGRSYLR